MGVPSFSGRGGGGGGGGGGVAVRFRPIQPVGEGGGGAVCFRPIQSMRNPRSRQIQPVDGGCCPLSANSASGGAHVCKQGGGGGGTPFSPEGEWEGAMAPLPHPLGTPVHA